MTDCDALKLIDEFIKRSAVPVHHHHDLYQYYSQETPRIGGRERREILLQPATNPSTSTTVSLAPTHINPKHLQPNQIAQHPAIIGHRNHRHHNYNNHHHPLLTATHLIHCHHSNASESSFDSSYHSTSYPSSSSRPVSIEKTGNPPLVTEIGHLNPHYNHHHHHTYIHNHYQNPHLSNNNNSPIATSAALSSTRDGCGHDDDLVMTSGRRLNMMTIADSPDNNTTHMSHSPMQSSSLSPAFPPSSSDAYEIDLTNCESKFILRQFGFLGSRLEFLAYFLKHFKCDTVKFHRLK